MYLLDENISSKVTAYLQKLGLEVTDTRECGLLGWDDDDIMAYARREGLIIISYDLDFSDIRQYPPDSHPGIIILRIRPKTVEMAQHVLARFLTSISIDDVRGAIVSLSADTYRIRRKG